MFFLFRANTVYPNSSCPLAVHSWVASTYATLGSAPSFLLALLARALASISGDDAAALLTKHLPAGPARELLGRVLTLAARPRSSSTAKETTGVDWGAVDELCAAETAADLSHKLPSGIGSALALVLGSYSDAQLGAISRSLTISASTSLWQLASQLRAGPPLPLTASPPTDAPHRPPGRLDSQPTQRTEYRAGGNSPRCLGGGGPPQQPALARLEEERFRALVLARCAVCARQSLPPLPVVSRDVAADASALHAAGKGRFMGADAARLGAVLSRCDAARAR